jgi:oligopeptide transport system substrate-binding protein
MKRAARHMLPLRTLLLPAALSFLFLTSVSAQALTVLNRGNSGEPKSLDPQFIDLTLESNIVGDLLMGLTTLDAAGRPIPGAATGWETSKDGKTWTFHIRNHQWSDGQPVTAQDFVFAWRRLLDPKTGAQYAYNLWVLKNGQAISGSKLPPEALGVKAVDDSTLVVQLEHPAAYLPELLTHDTGYPVPRHVLLAKGNAWAQVANYVGNGAYVPKEWIPNDHLTLVKNPRFYDAPNVHIDVVNYWPTQDTQAALKRFRAGEIDTQTPIPAANIDWMRAKIPAALHMKPYLGLSYIVMNLTRPPFNDVRVRAALNLAFYREVVTDKVLRLGDPPAYGYVPPGIANYPGGAAMDFRSMPYAERIARAQWLMRSAGYGPDNRLHTTYETTFDPDNKRVAAILQAMMRPIYVDVDIQQVDIQIHYSNMQLGAFDLANAAWIADFNDASNFLDLLRSNSGNNYGRYSNPAFDATMDAAQQEPDAVKRGQLLLKAEKIALKDFAWLPWRFRVTQDLVQPYVKGWIDNVRDFNRSRWLWIEGKPAAR